MGTVTLHRSAIGIEVDYVVLCHECSSALLGAGITSRPTIAASGPLHFMIGSYGLILVCATESLGLVGMNAKRPATPALCFFPGYKAVLFPLRGQDGSFPIW